MNAPLDELYLTWLYSQVGSVKLKNPARTHWSLLKQLLDTKFVWLVPNDDNRCEEGIDLRYEFINEREIRNPDQAWLDLECSMLELLLVLARHLSFEADGEVSDWFWHLIETLDLMQYNDFKYPDRGCKEVIDRTVNRVIFRHYDADGRGGLFPLRHPTRDQRKVELWFQLNAYLLEIL